MRVIVPPAAFPYDFEKQEYRALAHQLEDRGPADICFLGSSRAREAFVAPEVAELLEEAGVNGLSVANYALSSGFAAEMNSVLHRVVRCERKPRLVVYGVTPDQLAASRQHFNNSSLLWELRDWLRYYDRFGNDVLLYLPRAALNELKSRSLIFRWRDGMPLVLQRLIRRQPALSSPIRGELSVWQDDDPHVVYVASPQDGDQDIEWLREFFRDGVDWIDEIQSGLVQDSAKLCRDHGISLVFVELPLTVGLRNHFPGNVYGEFREFFAETAGRYGASFVTLEQLGLEMNEDEFRDSEHTNQPGALRVTRALTEEVILPSLESDGRRP